MYCTKNGKFKTHVIEVDIFANRFTFNFYLFSKDLNTFYKHEFN